VYVTSLVANHEPLPVGRTSSSSRRTGHTFCSQGALLRYLELQWPMPKHVWDQLRATSADELIAALKRDGYVLDPASRDADTLFSKEDAFR